jgi:type IV secretion/conjugal transfer VirB4 family ATPase
MGARPNFARVLGRENAVTEFLPYRSHIADDALIDRDGNLLRAWRVEGYSFETADPEDVQLRADQLNTLLRSIASDKTAVWAHVVRRKMTDRLDAEFDKAFCTELNDRYYDSFEGYRMMCTELFVTLIYRPMPKKLDKLFAKAAKRSIAEIKADITRSLKELDDLSRQVESSLKKYGIERLGAYTHLYRDKLGKEREIRCSEMLEFLHFLLTGERQRIRIPRVPLHEYLGNAWLFVGAESIEIRTPTRTRYAQGVDLKDYVTLTEPGLLDGLLMEDYEFIVTMSFSFLARYESHAFLKTTQNVLRNSEDGGVSQMEALSLAIDDLVDGKFAMGEFHFSLMVFGDTLEEAAHNKTQAVTVLQDMGFVAASIATATDAAYFAQLPGNWAYRPRVAKLTTLNFVGLFSLHNFASGKRERNPWGQAVTLFQTPSGQPFYFNFHDTREDDDAFDKKALGNTRVIGQSGSGKTVLLGFLYTQARKFRANSPTGFSTVFLDKDRGAEILIRRMGGRYLAVENGKPTGFNPFQQDETEANILFCNRLVRWLASQNGQRITTVEDLDIDRAVRLVFRMPKPMRGIATLTQNLREGVTREERENSLPKRLKKWCRGESLGWVMDCEENLLDFHVSDNIGIDGTAFLDNREVCTPVSMYILHKMREIIDGRRFFFMMDEFWKWLLDDVFSGFAYDELKTIRKMNGFGVFATQSPDEIFRSRIARAVVEQCATEIYLPNPKANYRDYVLGEGGEQGDFGLSQTEFDILRELDPDSRMFLIKQGHRSALATLNLRGFDDELTVISGSADNIELLHEVMAEVGEEPAVWWPVFNERRKARRL